eukprot:10804244-Alexandrium_andersonii.AAC.1
MQQSVAVNFRSKAAPPASPLRVAGGSSFKALLLFESHSPHDTPRLRAHWPSRSPPHLGTKTA